MAIASRTLWHSLNQLSKDTHNMKAQLALLNQNTTVLIYGVYSLLAVLLISVIVRWCTMWRSCAMSDSSVTGTGTGTCGLSSVDQKHYDGTHNNQHHATDYSQHQSQFESGTSQLAPGDGPDHDHIECQSRPVSSPTNITGLRNLTTQVVEKSGGTALNWKRRQGRLMKQRSERMGMPFAMIPGMNPKTHRNNLATDSAVSDTNNETEPCASNKITYFEPRSKF